MSKLTKRCEFCGTFIPKKDVFCKDCQNVKIEQFGEFRHGLCSQEIEEYIQRRANKKDIKDLVNKFNKIAGCNTCAVGPGGIILMYRWDVERFADVLFLGKPTYFD